MPRHPRPPGLRHLRVAGFTLIELLVVVLIIGILATMFGLSIGNRSLDERLQTEAQRLQQILKLALEEAETKGVQIGFRHSQEGYEFIALDADGQWTVMGGDGPLRPRELGVPFEIQLRVEGRMVAPAASPGFSAAQPVEPQFLLLSSGELMPFMLWLTVARQQESGFIIQGNMTGEIQLQPWSRETWTERASTTAASR